MATVSAADLEQMVDLLVREVNPRKVILFGSQARGETSEHSDLDIMIIEDEQSLTNGQGKLKHIAEIYRLLRVVRIPKDILVYSMAKFEEWQGSLNHVIGRAVREGRVLYERPYSLRVSESPSQNKQHLSPLRAFSGESFFPPSPPLPLSPSFRQVFP